MAPVLFIYYINNVYVPRVRANAYHVLTTPPRVFGDPKMCLHNIWTAPNVMLPFNGRVSLRLINRNPEELIFTTSFQETFSAYSPDSHSPHVELVKSVHPSQVSLLSDYNKQQCVGKNISI